MTQEEWADGELEPEVQPRLQLLPAPLVHADLSAASALAAPDEQRAASAVEVGLAQRQRLLDAQPRPPQHDDHTTQPTPLAAIAGCTHNGNDLLDSRGVRRLAKPLVAWRATAVKARHGRRRPTSTGAIEQRLRHDPSSGSNNESRIDPHQCLLNGPRPRQDHACCEEQAEAVEARLLAHRTTRPRPKQSR
jgi:hypothetical protein